MRFSILVPAYKQEFLDKALQSILNQSCGSWELIILNDCSPDDIRNTVSVYQDSRISYYENAENCGAVNVVDNWNKCLSYASGEYVICMGDDDKLDENALAQYNHYIDRFPSCDVFHTPSIKIDEQGQPLYVTNKRPEYESATSWLRHRLLGEEQFIGDYCFKRSTLNSLGGFVKLPLAWGSDDLTALACAKNNGIVNLQRPVFFYRESSRTISRTGNAELKMLALRQCEDFFRSFLSEECDDSLESLEKAGAFLKIGNYFFMRKMFTIAEDLSGRRSHFFKWYSMRKKYQISVPQLIMALGASLRKAR